jgi:6,7-dimethyl-8-ribityllumazine synthase
MTGTKMRVCFIEACWHQDIVDEIRRGFVDELGRKGDLNLAVISVPGILEIPLQAKFAAKTHQYDAIVAAGLVVTGGIYQYQFVLSAVVHALMSIQVEFEIPIISALFTPLGGEDEDRQEFFLRHAALKGKECAVACRAVITMTEAWRRASPALDESSA